MIVASCQHEHKRTNGKTKAGAVRYRCCTCGKSWTESTAKLDGMRIGIERAAQIVSMLCEGVSVLATARLTDTSKRTILDLLEFLGERCESFMQQKINGVHVSEIQIDELWAPVYCKAKTARLKKIVGGCGDSYTYVAVERSTKLVVTWHMGRRNELHTDRFCEKLAKATIGRFDLASDGWSAYPMAVWKHLYGRVDYGMLVKIYRESGEEDRRKYSPSRIIGAKRQRIIGVPERSKICTSHVERLNGSIRTFVKRMGRLTYCFSKKWDNHRSALALFFCHYNWVRKHSSLKGQTPAMAHGLSSYAWSTRELIEAVIEGV